MFIIEVLVCFAVMYKRYVVAKSLAKAGRPVSAIATSSSHIADAANVSANGASSKLARPIIRLQSVEPDGPAVVPSSPSQAQRCGAVTGLPALISPQAS